MQAIIVEKLNSGEYKAECEKGSHQGFYAHAEQCKDALLEKFWEESGHTIHWGPTISGSLPGNRTAFVLVKNSGYVKA